MPLGTYTRERERERRAGADIIIRRKKGMAETLLEDVELWERDGERRRISN